MTEYRVEIRPTKLDDVITLFNTTPSSTIKAYSVLVNDDLVAIAGVTYKNKQAIFFQDIKDDIDLPRQLIWRVSKSIVDFIKVMNLPVYAAANNEMPNSRRYLEKLGFSYIGEIKNEHVYKI